MSLWLVHLGVPRLVQFYLLSDKEMSKETGGSSRKIMRDAAPHTLRTLSALGFRRHTDEAIDYTASVVGDGQSFSGAGLTLNSRGKLFHLRNMLAAWFCGRAVAYSVPNVFKF